MADLSKRTDKNTNYFSRVCLYHKRTEKVSVYKKINTCWAKLKMSQTMYWRMRGLGLERCCLNRTRSLLKAIREILSHLFSIQTSFHHPLLSWSLFPFWSHAYWFAGEHRAICAWRASYESIPVLLKYCLQSQRMKRPYLWIHRY